MMKRLLLIGIFFFFFLEVSAQQEPSLLTGNVWKIDQFYVDKMPMSPSWKDSLIFVFRQDSTYSQLNKTMYSPSMRLESKWNFSNDYQKIFVKRNDILTQTYKVIILRANVLILEQESVANEDQSIHKVEYRLIPFL